MSEIDAVQDRSNAAKAKLDDELAKIDANGDLVLEAKERRRQEALARYDEERAKRNDGLTAIDAEIEDRRRRRVNHKRKAEEQARELLSDVPAAYATTKVASWRNLATDDLIEEYGAGDDKTRELFRLALPQLLDGRDAGEAMRLRELVTDPELAALAKEIDTLERSRQRVNQLVDPHRYGVAHRFGLR